MSSPGSGERVERKNHGPLNYIKRRKEGSRNRGRRDTGEKNLYIFDDVIIKKGQRRIE